MFLFDPDRMKAGDVVLERGDGLGASITANATGGRYSHALIWIDGGDFIEAMPTGVRTLQYIRVPVIDPDNWLLLRLEDGREPEAKAAALHARNHCFKMYDLEAALRSPLMPRKSMSASAVFCSQLIADAYLSVGIELLPGRLPSSITPNDLSRSTALKQADTPLIPAPYPALRFFEEYGLDRSSLYESAPMAAERDIAMRLYQRVKPEFEGIKWPGDETPGGLGDLQNILSFVDRSKADRIADILLNDMQEMGYFMLLIPHLNDLISSRTVAGRKELIPSYQHSYQRHIDNAKVCEAAFRRHPHQLWRELSNMYSINAVGFQALIEIASETIL